MVEPVCVWYAALFSLTVSGVSAPPGSLRCVCPVTCPGVHRCRAVVRAGVQAAAPRAERQESFWRDDGLGAVGAGGRGGADRRQSPERRE